MTSATCETTVLWPTATASRASVCARTSTKPVRTTAPAQVRDLSSNDWRVLIKCDLIITSLVSVTYLSAGNQLNLAVWVTQNTRVISSIM